MTWYQDLRVTRDKFWRGEWMKRVEIVGVLMVVPWCLRFATENCGEAAGVRRGLQGKACRAPKTLACAHLHDILAGRFYLCCNGDDCRKVAF